jgi:transposase
MPLVTAILMHVFAGARIHADDTTVPVLAKGKTRTGRLWTYVRDDRRLAVGAILDDDRPSADTFGKPRR